MKKYPSRGPVDSATSMKTTTATPITPPARLKLGVSVSSEGASNEEHKRHDRDENDHVSSFACRHSGAEHCGRRDGQANPGPEQCGCPAEGLLLI